MNTKTDVSRSDTVSNRDGRPVNRLPPGDAISTRRRKQRRFVALAMALLAGALLVTAIHRLGTPDGPSLDSGADRGSIRDAEGVASGMWIGTETLEALPMRGGAWERLVEVANEPLPDDTNLAHRDNHNVQTLAAALVADRRDDDDYRTKALDGLRTVMAARPSDDLLAAARRLSTYVIAADILDIATTEPDIDRRFRRWLDEMRHHPYSKRSFGDTIIDAAEGRPNNWGTHAGASRVAVAAYLDDEADLTRAATVFKGWLGDRDSYAEFTFGELDWQANPTRPVGINPAGATIEGNSVDGVLPDDQRRGGGFHWPPKQENYVWEALQGATVQAELLNRQGYDAWKWSDRALLRALNWLHVEAKYPAEGDDRWIPWLVNDAYGANFPTSETSTGKSMGFTDWTHAHAEQ